MRTVRLRVVSGEGGGVEWPSPSWGGAGWSDQVPGGWSDQVPGGGEGGRGGVTKSQVGGGRVEWPSPRWGGGGVTKSQVWGGGVDVLTWSGGEGGWPLVLPTSPPLNRMSDTHL